MEITQTGRPFDPHGVLQTVQRLADEEGLKAKEIKERLAKEGKNVGISTIYIYLRSPRQAA